LKGGRAIYYVSAHGFGHGTRSCDIIRALRRKNPQMDVTVVSGLAEDFLRSRLPEGVAVRRARFDVGLVHRDALQEDMTATLRELEELMERWEDLVVEEADYLARVGAAVVICDIPAIPLEAARRVGVPAVAASNFSWDWIYAAYAEGNAAWGRIIERFERGYAAAEVLLRLPFAPEMEVFRRKVDVPLVAEPGRARREEIAALTGADPGRRWLLLSFWALDLGRAALREMERLDDWEIMIVPPLFLEGKNIRVVERGLVPFQDLLASVDVVLSKPGFGIVSECIVNRRRFVHVERRIFPEYALLLKGVRRYLREVHLPSAALYRGEIRGALEEVMRKEEPRERMPAGGADKAADVIAAMARDAGLGE